MTNNAYSSSLSTINSSLSSTTNWYNTNPDVARLRMLGSIASSIDSAIPDDVTNALDKLNLTIQKGSLKTLRDKFFALFHGNGDSSSNSKQPDYKQYGILLVLQILSEVDLCGLTNPINNAQSTFTPNPNPASTDPKWKIQKVAYDISNIINFFNLVYNSAKDIATIRDQVEAILSALLGNCTKITSSDYLASSQINISYPITTIAKNTIDEFSIYITNHATVTTASKKDIDAILKKVNDVKTVCDLLIALQSPASFSKFSDKFINNSLSDSIKKLDQILKPNDNVINVLQSSLDTLTIIDQSLGIVANSLSLLQIVITITKAVIKVFTLVANFLLTLPIPGINVTVGVNVTFSSQYQKLLSYIKETIVSLSKLSKTIKKITFYVQGYLVLLDSTTQKLANIVAQLKSCSRNSNDAQDALLNNTSSTLDSLISKNQYFTDFFNNYQTNLTTSNNSYAGYLIQILVEEITDKEIQKYRIPRRYGVAYDQYGIVVVQSDPTYASDDNVIREQVILLLNSKGITNSTSNILTANDLSIINDASNFLKGDPISLDNLTLDTDYNLDSPNNENTTSGIGLNAYTNKLKGTKNLRTRVRGALQSKKDALQSNLSSTI